MLSLANKKAVVRLFDENFLKSLLAGHSKNDLEEYLAAMQIRARSYGSIKAALESIEIIGRGNDIVRLSVMKPDKSKKRFVLAVEFTLSSSNKINGIRWISQDNAVAKMSRVNLNDRIKGFLDNKIENYKRRKSQDIVFKSTPAESE